MRGRVVGDRMAGAHGEMWELGAWYWVMNSMLGKSFGRLGEILEGAKARMGKCLSPFQ